MPQRDILGGIAQARAKMMMRGYDPLRLEIGLAWWNELTHQVFLDCGAHLGGTGCEVLGMPTTVTEDMEGFAVYPLGQ